MRYPSNGNRDTASLGAALVRARHPCSEGRFTKEREGAELGIAINTVRIISITVAASTFFAGSGRGATCVSCMLKSTQTARRYQGASRWPLFSRTALLGRLAAAYRDLK